MTTLAALATRNAEFYGNKVFDSNAIRAMRPSLRPMALPWLSARRELCERGISLVTADQVARPSEAVLIAYDWTPDAERLVQQGAQPAALLSFEPPVIAWWLYAYLPSVSARFVHTLWFEGARARAKGRFHRLLFPQAFPDAQQPATPWRSRRFLTMINSNKVLARARDLPRWFDKPREVSLRRELAALRYPPIGRDSYRVRLAAIDAFADRGDFDLFGEGWQVRHPGTSVRLHAQAKRAYRGTIQDKFATLRQYRFALAIENTRFTGYVSEKLFDCIFAGTIPIYDGAPDISDYIPADAFIDLRQFSNWSTLEEYLRDMTDADAASYISAGRDYLGSADFRKFSGDAFAGELADALTDA